MQRFCCCCGNKSDKNQSNESVVVVNDDGAITTQPTNKSMNGSFKFTRSNGSQRSGFVNDAVEFDEIDLNERQMSERSRDKFNNNSNLNNHSKPKQKSAANEETINVTGLMLDQLYDSDGEKKKEETVQKHENCNDDHLSREIVEDYKIDSDAITEAAPDDIKTPEETSHRLTINLADDVTFCYCSDNASLTSEAIVSDPVPLPRTQKSPSNNSVAPEPPSISPPPWTPIKNCPDEPVHETKKVPFELDFTEMNIKTSESVDLPTTSARSEPSDPTTDEKPPYPANDGQQVIQEDIPKNRMYGGFFDRLFQFIFFLV
ncbi:hypothetical protein M3Y97_00745000 [Aphelenchoides bicaudatus]|nr:hypothetical protein M3Y97_00745000 [Aphelenchoides bicaudatus]